MDIDVYQKLAMKTAGPVDTQNEGELLAYVAIALTGETGELANKIKKMLWHGHPVDTYQIMDELGDVLWYVARAADLLGLSLNDIATMNLNKLALRYPKGFSSQASIDREI